ncbi:MAG: Dihydroorotate dehydrogenase B (NAD(+)), catalytic subunit [candidate division WS2 bacterium]|uniref:Dihydroorotate dehydrogenase n=1 Tax=Psychracetigena formicireducens TaxID=2986056 RepID=A0A9E2BGP4_PSYF1|nr:Dihydroorotate dehydrogenase B (NAD(+)), catalytic subunit [Candidatus Psychracetigena formicireducens]MBT9145261.1 Dihydroorotate dehydrogenase B (NAD(+)), catalytic subunit [Candidatus Psychracetigena formicireducens]
MSTVNLEVRIGNLFLKNPLIAAAGTYGPDSFELIPPNLFGAVCTKAVTLNPVQGNKPPRLFEVKGGLINRIGLQNQGVHQFVEEIYPRFSQYHTPVVINVAGFTANEYLKILEILEDKIKDLVIYELNVSCPNVEKGGMAICQHLPSLRRLLTKAREITNKPLWVKLPPQGELIKLLKVSEETLVEAVVIANTYRALTIDKATGEIYTGGLSGPAIKHLTLNLVNQARQLTPLPIVGCGGVSDLEGLMQYLKLGARAVQIGTSLFNNPETPSIIINELDNFLNISNQNSLWDYLNPPGSYKSIINKNKGVGKLQMGTQKIYSGKCIGAQKIKKDKSKN